jgi:hypothetical protein
VQRPRRARRSRGRAGGVLSRLRSAMGQCWRGHGGRQLAEREKEKRGGPGGVLRFLPCRTAWVGAEGARVDRGDVLEHGYRLRARENSDAHSASDFLDFCLPGVRRNARKKLKFEFLKIFTLGDQHNRQCFQGYFCYNERLSFAEITFQILGMVTILDSKFG